MAYLLYCLIASSLPCVPPRTKRSKAENPFDQTEYTGPAQDGPDRIALLESPVDGLNLRLELFDRAQDTLDLVFHTIHTGGSTSALFDAIVRAADRGVRVRILLDGKASSVRPSIGRMFKALSAHPGISCRRYNPLSPLKPWKWHFLMHDKYIIADGKYLLLGGRNLGDKFFAPESYTGKVSNDRDVIVVRGDDCAVESGVRQTSAYFEGMWNSPDSAPLRGAPAKQHDFEIALLHRDAAAFAQAHPAYYATPFEAFLSRTIPTRKITLLHNPMDTRHKAPWIWQQLHRIARNAEKSVLLQTPYVTANQAILSALGETASRVDLDVLTNSAASTPNFPAYSNYYAQRKKFVATGARIYEFQNAHSIHGKAMVVDGRLGILGSFNMDDRSMHLDTEIMLVVDSEAFAGMLSGAIGAYQAQSLCVNEANTYTIPDGACMADVPVYKVPLLRVVSVFSMALRSFI